MGYYRHKATTCRNGHPRAESYIIPSGRLVCLTCRKIASDLWRANNPAKTKASQIRKNQKLRASVIAFLGGQCVRCGFTDPRALQIAHVEGGGTREKERLHVGGVQRRVLTGAPGYQLLCANCNWIKRAERGEVAHRGSNKAKRIETEIEEEKQNGSS